MSFTRAKPAGWMNGELFVQAEVNQIDENQSRAIDGFAGGSYSPSADIEFPGAESIEWGATRYPKLSSRTLTRMQSLRLFFSTTVGGVADFAATSNAVPEAHVTQGDVSALVSCTFELDNLIDLATLTDVRVYIKPFAGSSPATLPAIRVIKNTTSSAWLTASKTDDFGGTYSDPHSFAITGMSEAIDHSSGSKYFLRFDGEQGAGATVGLRIFAIACSFATTLVTP
jgi:hypothetical protein